MTNKEVSKGYKKTEVGIIPDDWHVKSAIQICEMVVDCKNRTPPVIDGGEYAVVRTPNVRNGRFIHEELRFTDQASFQEWTARATPQKGDILITREAPLGEVCLVPKNMQVCLGQRMMLYRPSSNRTDHNFFLYALMAPAVQSCLKKKIGGSTVGHAKVDDIKNLTVPFPPTIQEQEAIAESLSDTDALIESLEKLIAKKRLIKQGAMQELLTGKRRLPGFREQKKYKKTEVGILPADWSVVTIGQSMQLINGRAFKPSDWVEQGIPIIRIQNLNDLDSPFNYCATTTYIQDKHKLTQGDLVFAWSGTKGTSFGARLWTGPSGVLNQHIFKVIAHPEKLTRRYALLILLKVQEAIEKQAHGFKASFVHVKKADLVGVSLSLPSLNEQEAIATILSDMDTEISTLEEKLAKIKQIKQGMMNELLTGRIRLI